MSRVTRSDGIEKDKGRLPLVLFNVYAICSKSVFRADNTQIHQSTGGIVDEHQKRAR